MVTTELKNNENSVENTDNNNSGKIVDRQEIKGTNFTAITLDTEAGEQRFIAWGNNRITNFLTFEELNVKVHDLENGKVDWEIVGAMAAIMAIEMNKNN